MAWHIPKIWQDGTAWIIGGGTSILDEFGIPLDLARKVIRGELPLSEYSKYLEPIHNKHTIGVNHAFLIGNWIDVFYFSDTAMWDNEQLTEQMMEFRGLRITNNAVYTDEMYDQTGIKYVKRSEKKRYGLTDEKDAVCLNNNTGLSAIDLAYHFGAKRIILLGFDMTVGPLDSHIHGINTRFSRGEDPTRSFKRHMLSVGNIWKDARDKGIEILNASQISKIPLFPKVRAKDYF